MMSPIVRRTIVIASLALVAGLAACGNDDASTATRSTAIVVGTCERNLDVLAAPPAECTTDLDCPCGSFCDGASNTCAYECLPPDVTGDAPACDAPAVCDDFGHCATPGSGPPGVAATLAADPPVLTTVAAGAAESFDVELRLVDATPTELTAAQHTVVRVLGRDGAQVSCDGATWGAECQLTSWSFVFGAGGHQAAQTASVRTVAGTEDGHGQVILFVDGTRTKLIVPAAAGQPMTDGTGLYGGVATSPDYPAGVAVTARIRDGQLLVRDPSRTLAPDGALLLDLRTSAQQPETWRRMVWLRGPGASTGGIVGRYAAGVATVDLDARTVELPLQLDVPGAVGLDAWEVQLVRAGDHRPECSATVACAGGEVCAPSLQACVPASVWAPTTLTVGNQLDDARSAVWWSAIAPWLETRSAFATTGPDLVESVLCSASESAAGRVGVSQLQYPNTGVSRSGDLTCISPGATTPAPGAVGMVTLADRAPPSAVVSPTLLETCMDDLEREPSASFAAQLGPSVGECVNLARFVPALRLLATDDLGRATRAQREPRGRGLTVRLVQQWTMLHGFLASTGLAARDYDDGLVSTPPAETRETLIELLDRLDEGWSALLDRRVASSVADAVRWAPLAPDSPSRDYRLVKRPVVYWPFNGMSYPNLDLLHYTWLLPQAYFTGGVSCGLSHDRSSFLQGYDCPGFQATLPGAAPSLLADPNLGGAGLYDNVTITLNVDALDRPIATATATANRTYARRPPPGEDDPPEPDDPPEEDPRPPREPPDNTPPYRGGTLLVTPTLAVAEAVDANGQRSLVVVHPTAGGVEWVTFTGYGVLGRVPPGPRDGIAQGSSLALVRDATAKTYTLYVRQPGGLVELMQSYQHEPTGILDMVASDQVLLGAAYWVQPDHYWAPYKRSYPGTLDDVAIFDSAMSRTEFVRWSNARGFVENRRDVWPEDMVLTDHATQEIAAPLGAQLLETQVTHLEVVARLLDRIGDLTQVACDGAASDAANARIAVDAVIARAGRTLRQSHLVEGLAAIDTSDRADAARKLLQAKRLELARSLAPMRCAEPFGMAADEVPIYHNSISPQSDPKGAFFAASDHLLALAEARRREATDALTNARAAWNLARQSEIQQLQSDQARDMRVDELTTKYGDAMRRLCGVPGQTPAQIVAALLDPDHPFAVETCFVQPTPACLAQHDGELADTDPTCYRGAIGASVIDIRTAYFAYQAAHQSWLAASANAASAQKLCILKEVDLEGCTVLDRYELSGVECPAGGEQGTLQLIDEFNELARKKEKEDAIFGAITGIAASVGTALVNPGLAVEDITKKTIVGLSLATGGGVLSSVLPLLQTSMEDRRRQLDAVMTARSARAEIRSCWVQADQIERSIASAEDAAKQALSQLDAANLAFANALAEAHQIVLEAPVVIERERERASIPIAFHYWLAEDLATYQRLFESARRYTYIALRATEYDTQDTYTTPMDPRPLRSAVLGATHPEQLRAQLERLRGQTQPRLVWGNEPKLGHMTFDLGHRYFGLPESSPDFGSALKAHLRPVYSSTAEYLGQGVRFSLVPKNDADVPVWRCAERIWRVNVGAVGFPSGNSGAMHLKLIKRNVFASRQCKRDGLRTATWRPEANLLVGGGDPAVYQTPASSSVADISVFRLDVAGALQDFREREEAYNGSSTELSLRGLYGDYVLLFPVTALDAGLDPGSLMDFNLRFDFVSVDDTPAVNFRTKRPDAAIQLDTSTGPITAD